MAWQDTLLDASFRGVRFDVQNVDRSGARSIAQNEYPYTAGADLDDLGLKARKFRFKAIVWGDDYEDRLQQLVDALEAPGAGELVHPVYGGLQAMAESWEDQHEADLVDGVMLQITFVEHTTRTVVFIGAGNTLDAVAARADESRSAADDALVRRVEALQNEPALRLSILKDAFSQAKAALTKLSDTTGLRAILSDLDPVLYPRAYVADLVAVVDRALQGLPFGGRNLLFDNASGTPSVAGSGMNDFTTAATQLSPGQVVVTPAVAAPSADMQADAAAVQAHARVHAASSLADCALIVLAGELDKPLLDRAEIEALANAVRAGIQKAIDAARTALDAEGRGQVCTSLRALAYAVQEAARTVINRRPPLVRRASPIDGPVRLVAHQIYGDTARAPEITRINRLGRKVYIDRGDALHVYAS
jgi:prophage DNA circulation protein